MSESTTAPPRRVAPFVAGAVALVLAVLFGVLLVVEPSSDTAETVLLDRAAPAAVGEFDDGTAFELSRRRGSWVVLNFFTSTCIPCRNEHPELIEFVDQQRSLGVNGAEFYTIVQNDDPADVAAFFDEFGGDWPVCTLGAPLREWVAALRQIVKGHSEEDQRRILHDNAVRLYGLA